MIDKARVKKAVLDLLEALGEDTSRPGIYETPERVARMYEEIFCGMESDPRQYLKFFSMDGEKDENAENTETSGTVIVKDIPIHSMCEHHLLPFVGSVHIAYIPGNGKILGLSKFARIVNCFAGRLQVQERLTDQIARFLYENVQAKGVAVMIEAEHLCMTMRGAKAHGSKTKTAAFYGIFAEDLNQKAEILSMLG